MGKTLQLKRDIAVVAMAFFGFTATWADKTVVYEADMSQANAPEGWQCVKPKADGKWDTGNWRFSSYYHGYFVSQSKYTGGLNEYCMSKGIALEKGKTYTVTTSMNYTGGSAPTASLELLNDASKYDASNVVASKSLNPNKDTKADETNEFTVSEDGTYYFTVHINNPVDPQDGTRYTYLYGFKVEADDASITDPSTPDTSDTKVLLDDHFTAASALDWTVIDNDKDENTWTYKTYCSFNYFPAFQYVQNKFGAGADDYCTSKAVELKKGMKYKVTTSATYQNTIPVLTLELGTNKDDVATYSSVATITPSDTYEGREQEHEITVPEDGTYYLSYHIKQGAADSKVYLFGLKLEEAGEVTPDKPDTPDQPGEDDSVLKADFSTEPTDWTNIHKGSSFDWGWNSYGFGGHAAMRFMQGSYADYVDAYTVSPAVELKKGRLYTITTEAAYEAGIPTLTLELGTNNADAASFKKVSDITPAATYEERASEIKEFTVAQDGTYYFAYHMYQTDAASRKAYVFGLKVVDAGEAPVVTPTPASVTNLDYSVDCDAKEVTLTWTNPTKDAEGNDLTEKVGAKIYKNDETEPIKTIDELTGETTTIKVSPEPFEGDVTLTVKAFVGDKESEAATVTANLDKPVAPSENIPYSADLSDAETVKNFTVVDANSDNVTWTAVEGVNGLTYDSQTAKAAANDWVITPAIKFEENKNYAVTTKFAHSGAFDDDIVEVYAGSEATAEKMTKKIGSLSLKADEMNIETKLRYICSDVNDKFIGFRLVTESGDNGLLSLTSVSVDAIESATPMGVTDLKAEVNSEEKNVTLTWTNPTKDTDGYDIAETIGVKVYENDVLVKTVDDAKDGKLVYSPESFSGKATYKVVPFIGEKEGAAAETTVNLDDLNGELVLVKAFDFDKASANYWTIINADKNTSKWSFDYDGFYFGGGSEADDWLISPALSLSAKDRFVLKYQLKTAWTPKNNTFFVDVDVTVGQGVTADKQTTVVNSHKGLSQNGYTEFQTKQFAVPEDGQYNFGFHVTALSGNLSMRNLAVYSVGKPTTGINEVVNGGVVAYNKANGALFVPAGSKVALYAVNGAVAMQTVADGQAINLNSLANGIYVMKVTGVDGKVMTQKIVK